MNAPIDRRGGRPLSGRGFLLSAAALAALLSLALWLGLPAGGLFTERGREAGTDRWEVWAGPSFDLVYDPALTPDPARVADELESAGRPAAAFLGQPWPLMRSPGHPVSDPSSPPAFILGARAEAPPWLEGRYLASLDPTSAASVREAAAGLVLAHAAGATRVSAALTTGLAHRIDPDPLPAEALAAALGERERLASLPQLLRWWPSLPYGEEQLGCLVGFIAERWGNERLTAFARRSPETFPQLSWLNNDCTSALGVPLVEVDREWVAHVEALAAKLDPSTLGEARAAVDRQLTMVRLRTIALAALAAAFFAWSAAALGPRRRETALALIAFGTAAAVELVLFTGSLPAPVKSLVALSEVLVFIGLLAAVRRPRDTGPPAAVSSPGVVGSEAVPQPGAWRAFLIAAALSFAVMAPRFGLYYYCREIWAKAPMIVLVLALVYLVERRGADGAASVGLGRMPLGRLLLVAAAGIVAFRLTTGLTEVVFNSIFTRITGPAFSWYIYEPWWRAVGFLHYPFVDWPAWFPALDVGDFVFGNFAEEIFFRGYLLTRLESSMGWWKALLGQALLFGVFHINYDLFPFHPLPMVMYVLMATVFGVLMGLLLRYSGSLLVPALVHPMANLGVLWVGVTTAGSGITWLTLPLYYTLQLVLGLVLIPLVLRAVTGRFGPPVGPERPRRSPRTIAKQWIEPRYP